MKRQRTIHSVDQLIGLFGDVGSAAATFGISKTALHNWRSRGGIPWKHFRVTTKLLAARGAMAADDLFADATNSVGKGGSLRGAERTGLITLEVSGDDVARLKRRAARHGRPVKAEHREILRQALTAEVEPDFDSLAAELRALTAGRPHTPAERLATSARAVLIARLKRQPVVKAGRWTREELYERNQ